MLGSYRSLLLCAAMLLGVLTQGCASRFSSTTSGSTPPVLHATEIAAPVPIIVVQGTSEEMGQKAGEALKSRIDTLHSAYMAALFQDPRARQLALQNASRYANQISPEHLAEIRALSQACGMDYDHTLLSQCFLDIIPMVACSTVSLPADASPDGVARMGRNLDFPSMGVADKESMIIVYKPADRYHFATITWPGLIGALTGMNEHGLVLANMEVTRLPSPPKGMPYVLLYRTVLEKCKTVDEAIVLLKSMPKQTANNLMLMDAAGNRAVVEINPPGVTVRAGRPGEALLSTNHQRGQDYTKPNRCPRYDRMLKLSAEKFGSIDESTMQTIIQSASVRHFTLQSMVFEPANRMIYLSTGESAGEGPYHRIDLGALMK